MVVAVVAVSWGGQWRLHGQEAHGDCRTIAILERLARVYGTIDAEVIERERIRICSAPAPKGSAKWPNGETMKTAGGTWSYPNGAQARSAGGSWAYPNKKLARSVGGSWSYPDGIQARSVGGRWTSPWGESSGLDDLRSWAQKRVPVAALKRLTTEIGSGQTDEEIAATLELMWLAR